MNTCDHVFKKKIDTGMFLVHYVSVFVTFVTVRPIIKPIREKI